MGDVMSRFVELHCDGESRWFAHTLIATVNKDAAGSVIMLSTGFYVAADETPAQVLALLASAAPTPAVTVTEEMLTRACDAYIDTKLGYRNSMRAALIAALAPEQQP
jgi:hypothetical protein